ncbi:MAG TPA: hypothetical protein VF812_07615 [Ktedonobacterales bacterium]
MADMPYLDPGSAQHILEQPMMCAECGLQMRSDQIADECELCGAPRCRACAAQQAGDSVGGRYICSACAADL